ncbi:right-handed parallel beta-helix repeat-containing protein [Haladaptatus pallidirubidus]|uniref:Right handed beta helix domain-containing protein n=1 Tax=Haladaptatus pallidirubidus TaxID=1008152 RepID=A0AAV3UDZ8_9EURY|nr:right-handed parallel beta-helix repeat-containing protein [Haladaptatus pallidirubidus]
MQSSNDTCIEIDADDVDFDGNGHLITGEQVAGIPEGRPKTNAVAADNQTNVTVHNVEIGEWWYYGVHYTNVDDGTVRDATITRTNNGVEFDASDDGTVSNVTIRDGLLSGVVLSETTDTTVSDVRSIENDERGIYLFHSDNNALRDVTANRNRGMGRGGVVLSDSNNNSLSNVTARENPANGILVWNGDENTMSEVTTDDNGYGVVIEGSQNSVTNATVTKSTNQAIRIEGADNAFRNVDASPNTGGVLLLGENQTLVNTTVGAFGLAQARRLEIGARNSTLKNTTVNGSEGTEITFNGDAANNTLINTTIPNSEASDAIFLLAGTTNNTLINTFVSGEYYTNAFRSLGNDDTTAINFSLETATISFRSRAVEIEKTQTVPPSPEGYRDIGQYVNVTNTSEDSSIDLKVHYSDDDVAQAGVDESTLRIWKYDGGSWTEVPPPNGVNTEANVVYANVTNFSAFAPLGEPAESDEPFLDPLVIELGNVTIAEIGPPQDHDDDGLYEDVNGDCELTGDDVAALSLVEIAHERGALELTDEQVAALDFDGDGRLTQRDVGRESTDVSA